MTLTEKKDSFFTEVKNNTKEAFRLTNYFNQAIVPLYGEQSKALKKIFDTKDRSAEFFRDSSDNKDLGLIVYKNYLTNEFDNLGHKNTFEIKTLFVISPKKNHGKKIALNLLYKTALLAEEKNAQNIHVTVSSAKPESLTFFLKNGFEIKLIKKNLYIDNLDEYFLFHKNPEKLRINLNKAISISASLPSKLKISGLNPENKKINTIEYKIIALFCIGKSLSKIQRLIYADTNLNVDKSDILKAVDVFINLTTITKSNKISKNMLFIFQEPIFSLGVSNEIIGCLTIGIDKKGKKYLLHYSPAIILPYTYWEKIFKKIKETGIDSVNIVSLIDKSANAVFSSFFPKVRICTSFIPKERDVNYVMPLYQGLQLINLSNNVLRVRQSLYLLEEKTKLLELSEN